MAPAIDIMEKHELQSDTSANEIVDVVLIPGDPMELSNEIGNGLIEGPYRPFEIDQGIVIGSTQQLREEIIRASDSIEIDQYNFNEINPADSTTSATVDPGNSTDETLNTNNESEKDEVISSHDTVQNLTENENFDDDSYLKVIPITVPSSKY